MPVTEKNLIITCFLVKFFKSLRPFKVKTKTGLKDYITSCYYYFVTGKILKLFDKVLEKFDLLGIGLL